MTELRDLLTQALGAAPSVPAEPRLSPSIEATAYWTFAPSLEVVLARAERLPPEGQAVAAWTKRLNKRAIPLVLAIEAGGDVSDVLVRFEEMRRPTVEKITAAAARSYNWYEHFHERMALPPLEFAMSYATRSGRISRAQLEQISPRVLARYDQWMACNDS